MDKNHVAQEKRTLYVKYFGALATFLVLLFITTWLTYRSLLTFDASKQNSVVEKMNADQPDSSESTPERPNADLPNVSDESPKAESDRYINTTYGFSLQFPDTWQPVIVTTRKQEADFTGEIIGLHFSPPKAHTLLTIWVYTKEQWDKKTYYPSSTFLGENDKYVFLHNRARHVTSQDLTNRLAEVSSIVRSFSVERAEPALRD